MLGEKKKKKRETKPPTQLGKEQKANVFCKGKRQTKYKAKLREMGTSLLLLFCPVFLFSVSEPEKADYRNAAPAGQQLG